MGALVQKKHQVPKGKVAGSEGLWHERCTHTPDAAGSKIIDVREPQESKDTDVNDDSNEQRRLKWIKTWRERSCTVFIRVNNVNKIVVDKKYV